MSLSFSEIPFISEIVSISIKGNSVLKPKDFVPCKLLLQIFLVFIISTLPSVLKIFGRSCLRHCQISKKLDFLIVGNSKPTKKKIDQAKDLGIKVITEKEWEKILNS